MKAGVVYWSGTGNTEAMAKAILEGMKEGGCEAEIFTASEVKPEDIDKMDAIAFGCPSMGSEQLEESEFEPMFEACKSKLGGKKVALFGSYGWGDGEWMRIWESDCKDAGIDLATDSVMCNEAPDDSALDECKMLGQNLVM